MSDRGSMLRELVLAFRSRIEGSDHGISEFADYVDEVLAFCGYGPGGKVPANAGAA